jgi:hypothetical protein
MSHFIVNAAVFKHSEQLQERPPLAMNVSISGTKMSRKMFSEVET